MLVGMHKAAIQQSLRRPKAKSGPKKRKPAVSTVQTSAQGAVPWEDMSHNVSVDSRLWLAKWRQDLWNAALAPHNGKALKTKQSLPEYNPCPCELFYALIRPILKNGVTVKRSTDARGKVVREVEETNLT